MRRQFTEQISAIIREDPTACLLLGDIGVYGFRNVIEQYPKRALNFGILEQSMVSAASGMAIAGLNPIIHTIAPFLIERALEQIKIDFAYQNLSVNLVSVGGSFDYSKLGATHHCPADVSILSKIPGTLILLPGTSAEFEFQFNAFYKYPGIKYYRLTENENSISYSETSENGAIVKVGEEVCVVVFGNLLDQVVNACHELNVTVVYLNRLFGEFSDGVRDEFRRHRRFIVIEPFYEGTTSYFLHNSVGLNREIAMSFIGIPLQFIDTYLSYAETLEKLGLNAAGIRRRILEFVEEC